MAVSFQTKNLGEVCVLSPEGKIVIGEEVGLLREKSKNCSRENEKMRGIVSSLEQFFDLLPQQTTFLPDDDLPPRSGHRKLHPSFSFGKRNIFRISLPPSSCDGVFIWTCPNRSKSLANYKTFPRSRQRHKAEVLFFKADSGTDIRAMVAEAARPSIHRWASGEGDFAESRRSGKALALETEPLADHFGLRWMG